MIGAQGLRRTYACMRTHLLNAVELHTPIVAHVHNGHRDDPIIQIGGVSDVHAELSIHMLLLPFLLPPSGGGCGGAVFL